jgi:LysM repeat protein
LSNRSAPSVEPTPSRTPVSTFTPMPFSTATAIIMPTFSPLPPTATPIVHVVVLGETLETIATGYGISQAALLEANGLEAPADLKPGDQLIIPIGE